jgi:hypothetical protein
LPSPPATLLVRCRTAEAGGRRCPNWPGSARRRRREWESFAVSAHRSMKVWQYSDYGQVVRRLLRVLSAFALRQIR